MKKIIIISTIIGLIGVSIFFMLKKKNSVTYVEETLKNHTIIETVEASGIINPITSVNIGAQVSGMIAALYADFNSEIKKGQLLAEIDTSLFEAQVDQARANLQNARASYSQAKSVADNDLKTYNRYKNLYARNYIAKSELDLAESTYYANAAKVQSALAQISQREAELQTALTNLKYTKIISPVDGVVISREVDEGQTVISNMQTQTLFLVAQDLSKMQIETNVSEADIGQVKEGQDVDYSLDGYPDRIFKGKVKQVRISPTTVSNVVTYVVVVEVDNEENLLKPGMSANVSIITNKKENIVCASNAAIKFTPHKGTDAPKYQENGLWILEKGKPKRITIKTGMRDEMYTEIISDKLKTGDKIISGMDDGNKKQNKRGMRFI